MARAACSPAVLRAGRMFRHCFSHHKVDRKGRADNGRGPGKANGFPIPAVRRLLSPLVARGPYRPSFEVVALQGIGSDPTPLSRFGIRGQH